MPGDDQAGSKGRPALATAGGVLLAIAVLQIGEQVVGAFSPRPSVQAVLGVAAGLAALTAERLREVRGRRDWVVVAAGVGSLAALGVVVAISVAVGFTKPTPVPLGEQVATLRTSLIRAGYAVKYRQLALGEGQPSYLFVLTRRPHTSSEPPPMSDEVRLYGVSGGKLRQRLAYRPVVTTFAETNAGQVVPSGPDPAAFRISSITDIDGDGQREVLASYDLNLAGEEYQRVPVMLARDVLRRRYVMTPLLRTRALGPATTGLMTFLFGPAGTRPERVVWVNNLHVDVAHMFVPEHATLATSVGRPPQSDPLKLTFRAPSTDARGHVNPLFTIGVRLWELDVDSGRPQVRPLCPRAASPAVGPTPLAVLTRAPFLGRPLADRITEAGMAVGELVQGQCLEAGS